MGSRVVRAGLMTAALGAMVACGSTPTSVAARPTPSPRDRAPGIAQGAASSTPAVAPTSKRRGNIYAAIKGALAPAVRGIPTRVYVPDNNSNDVRVIDPRTFKVVRTFPVEAEPQHITPSWDMKHLYVGNVYGNSLTEIDPRTGTPTRTIAVPDPYNLYFTPDGRTAIDVEEGHDALAFFDPRTWTLRQTLPIPYRGPDHLDFSPDGRYLLISTEYAGEVVKVGLDPPRILGNVALGGSTVDVKLAPNGNVFFVADQLRGGVWVVDPVAMRALRFIPTGAGAHGFAIARDAEHLYVSNRLAGSISLIDTRTRSVAATWLVGGSPDMLQVSANGRELWASNRFDATVSVIDTRTGKVLHVVPVGVRPHGLTLFPQPGRYSLGHNGVYR